jgi:SAM-dependent methyltransferase
MRRAWCAHRADHQVFRAALTAVPERSRDDWVNQVLGLDELPSDGPELPRGCVPYLPSSVNTLLRMIDLAGVHQGDVFVDIGCGLGRATTLTHLVTGASAIGVEIQPALVQAARELASRMNAEGVSVIEGDAATVTRQLTTGSLFFLYCPFSGARLDQVLDALELIARTRVIRVCSLDLPLPSRSWLAPVALSGGLAVYTSQHSVSAAVAP